MRLEMSAEQVTEITTEEVELQFTPTVTNTERGGQPEVSVATDAHCPHGITSYEANDIVANSRKEPWRRLQRRSEPSYAR